jgi:methyl acetate hydrolase
MGRTPIGSVAWSSGSAGSRSKSFAAPRSSIRSAWAIPASCSDPTCARLATCYQRQADGSLEPLADTFPERPAVFSAGGGLFSTGADYLRFLRMFLGDGQFDGARLLRPETVALLAENHVGALDAGDLRSVRPERSNDGLFFPGIAKRWGLAGMITTELAPTGRSAGSWSWAGLYNTYFWVDPARRITGLILTQILPFCDRPVLDLFADFERAIYDLCG